MPLLFILADDTLAICTEQLCICGYLVGFQTTGQPGGILLLQYEDDTTFFLRGSMVAAHHVSTMLDIFSDFSGLQVNRGKSSVVGIGLSLEELDRVSAMLATPVALLPFRYLGLPIAEGRLHTCDWQPILAKIEARLGGWQAQVLSRGGHSVLLQSVLAAILIYFMAIFRMSEGVRRQIESIMRRFLWQGTRPWETRGVALVAWRTVCRPKSLGGLGIRHLRHTNRALLSNWVRCIMQQSGDLAVVVLRGSYGASINWPLWSTLVEGIRPSCRG